MKLLLIIDHLGLGGAQRQIVELACGLAQRGHTVELFNYFPQHDFFLPRIMKYNIAVHEYRKGRGFSAGVVGAIASLLRHGNFDLAVSFLNNPNIYAELAGLTKQGSRLVVSERCSFHDDRPIVSAGRRLLHAFSDHVVTNSQSHAAWLRKKWWLRAKVTCIYNGLDLDMPTICDQRSRSHLKVRLLAVGRVCAQKNPLKLIEALHCFNSEHGYVPTLNWAGSRDASRAGRRYGARVDALLARVPEVAASWHWLGEQTDMASLFRQHDALIHPSLYEGLPNAVCEALAVGLPVLVSDVCDHPLLVAEGVRGFRFDPTDAQSIARGIEKAMKLDTNSWLALSRNARKYAESHLGLGNMIAAYEKLFIHLIERRAATANETLGN